jgi:hypothetical protein
MAPQTERLGVSSLDLFFSSNGWLFREQTTHDYGIDAHVEIVEGGRPTGKLIALQIKSGKSFFSEETPDAYVFRTDDNHVTYWVEHSMPVALVLYHPEPKQLYWQEVSESTVERTGKNWKILVPKINVFSDVKRTLQAFAALTQPEPYIRRLNKLRIDRPWMEMLEQGDEVRIQFDDWVNKSLPRFQITITCGKESEQWPMVYGGGISIEALLEHYLPWADVSLDQDVHREAAKDDWMAVCYTSVDSETGQVFYRMPFDEWYEPPRHDEIIPISSNGETASYSLLLSLNELGQSFLQVDDFLCQKSDFELKTFTLD